MSTNETDKPGQVVARAHHVYAVASGFGLRVIPLAPPYAFTLGPDPAQLDVERNTAAGDLFARLTPTGGGYTSKTAEDVPSLYDVVDVTAGPPFDRWWIETTAYRVPLPSEWQAVAGGAVDPCVFDLVGPDGALMFVQVGNTIPAPDALVGPGQLIVNGGRDARSSWVELRYQHEGEEWAQRHDIVEAGRRCLLLTIQARFAAFAACSSAHRLVLEGLAASGKSTGADC